MNALIIHGIFGKAGENWSQWLYDQLVASGYTVIMPSLSNPERPDRQSWLSEVSSLVADTDPTQLVIIAHSLGVATALDYVETIDKPLKKLVCVSGSATPYGLELNEYYMQQKTIDFEKVRTNLAAASVFYGNNDPYVTQDALQDLADKLSVTPTVIPGGGHLNAEADFTEFPEVLTSITGTE